jgi:methylmalonyl-CoA/ethylmalonyl-CoA epimerase
MTSLDHIGIAIKSLHDALRIYRDLVGLDVYKEEFIDTEGLLTHFIDAGDTKIELLASDDPDSPVGRFVARRGPGMHHIAFSVDDLGAALDRAGELGLQVVGEAPRIGADGKLVAFIHPRDGHGVLIELCEDVNEPIGVNDGPPIPARVLGRGPHVLTAVGDGDYYNTRSVVKLLRAIKLNGRVLLVDQDEHAVEGTEIRNLIQAFGQVGHPVIGFGNGAAVALRATENHPELFSHVILVEPPGGAVEGGPSTLTVDIIRSSIDADTVLSGGSIHVLPLASRFEDALLTRVYALLIRHLIAQEA